MAIAGANLDDGKILEQFNPPRRPNALAQLSPVGRDLVSMSKSDGHGGAAVTPQDGPEMTPGVPFDWERFEIFAAVQIKTLEVIEAENLLGEGRDALAVGVVIGSKEVGNRAEGQIGGKDGTAGRTLLVSMR